MRNYIKQIENEGITPKLLFRILSAHKDDREQRLQMYERYKASTEAVEIFSHSPVEYEDFERGGNVKRLDKEINNQLNNAFEAEIVDTRVGYLHGVPITYSLKEDKQDEIVKSFINDFVLRNSLEDADSELGKMAAICGYSARLAYIDKDGEVRIENLDPFNVVLLGNDIEPSYAIYYYKEVDPITQKQKWHVEFYDEQYYYVYEGDGLDNLREVDLFEHLFEYVPLFGVPNNKERMGDAERVKHLIDDYDLTMSNASSEITQTRLAYLVLRGMGLDEEDIQNTQRNGVFELFDERMDVKYLTKDVNDSMIENHLNRLEKNIMRFSKSVNFNSDEFNGQVPVIGMALKLMALENKCMTFERKMSAMLRYQFKVIFSAMSKKLGVDSKSYLDVQFTFGRNIPINKLEEAQVLAMLKDNVSERTRLGQSALVKDVETELIDMDKELLGGVADESENDTTVDRETDKEV